MIDKEKKNYIGIYEYLSKYLYAIESIQSITQNKKSNDSDNIWQCWLQWKENMPDLVKVCTDSVRKYNPNKNVVLITEENYSNYISIPDYILEKYKKGLIPDAQFSDIIRLTLLEKYGGIWIDSTILLTDYLPQIVYNLDFFTHKNTLGQCFSNIKNIKHIKSESL